MPDTETLIKDVLMDPIEKILFHTGKGIASAQLELDKNSMATQVLIDNDEDLSNMGLRATWHHFAETNLEIKMSLSMHQVVYKKAEKSIARYKIYAAPMNARYKNSFNYDVYGASTVNAKVVSVPPPKEVV